LQIKRQQLQQQEQKQPQQRQVNFQVLPDYFLKEIRDINYEQILKAKTVSLLIAEMEVLKYDLRVLGEELANCDTEAFAKRLSDQEKAIESKLTGVEMEIGRRLNKRRSSSQDLGE
jgi:23S rRNA A2030 N6-methylase RlmJ